MNNGKECFVDKCVRICSMDKESILKDIAKETFDIVCETKPQVSSGTFDDILNYIPSVHTFIDYTFHLYGCTVEREVLIRNILGSEFDKITTRKRDSVPEDSEVIQVVSKRSRTRRGGRRNTATDDIVDNSTNSANSAVILPGILSVFTKLVRPGEFEVLNDLNEIMDTYFNGNVIVHDGVFCNQSSDVFVIVVCDKDSPKGTWTSHGRQNKLKWKTPSGDADHMTFDTIIGVRSTVHVIRKRNNELRYMGQCKSIDEVDEVDGSCVMYVS